jgi:hypothetical protein
MKKQGTLLRKALQAGYRPPISYRRSAEEIELALAWARGEIESYQLAAAKGFDNRANRHAYVYKFIAECFSAYIRQKGA